MTNQNTQTPERVEAEIVSPEEAMPIVAQNEAAPLAAANEAGAIAPLDKRQTVRHTSNEGIPQWLVDRMVPLNLTPEQIAILQAPIDPRDVRIKQGIPYLPWQVAADRFNAAFGVGRWAVQKISNIIVIDRRHTSSGKIEERVVQDFALMVDGQWTMYWTTAEHSYIAGGANMIPPHESLKSSAYFRILKMLGGGRELNDSAWVEAWKRKYANRSMTVFIDADDVLAAYDAIASQSTVESALRVLTSAANDDKKAAQKVAEFLQRRYGDHWSYIVMRHAYSHLHPGTTAMTELRVLVEHVVGSFEEASAEQSESTR